MHINSLYLLDIDDRNAHENHPITRPSAVFMGAVARVYWTWLTREACYSYSGYDGAVFHNNQRTGIWEEHE